MIVTIYRSKATYEFKQGNNNTMLGDEGKWRVYPNPSANEFTIFYAANEYKEVEYSVLDMIGRDLLHGSVQSDRTAVDGSMLVPGLYVIKLTKQGRNCGQMQFVKH